MGYNDCTSGSNRSLCLLRFSKRVAQIESRRWHHLGVPTTSQQPCVLPRKRIISQSDHGACLEAHRVPIPTHRHLDYSRVQRKVTGNTGLATYLYSDWIFLCMEINLCHPSWCVTSLKMNWIERETRLPVIIIPASSAGRGVCPFFCVRRQWVIGVSGTNITLYQSRQERQKSRVGTTSVLYLYSNLKVLKLLRQWGQNNQRVESDGFWFSHNVTKSLSDMLMHCNAGCEKPCINWDKVACKEHADFFLYLMSECWKRFYSSA